MQDLEHIFEQLKSINQAGVYCLADNANKRYYINQSSNIAKSLIRLLSGPLFIPEYEFNILELVTDPINLRPRCQFYKDWYASKGYDIINPNKVSNLKLRIDVIDEFRVINDMKALFRIQVVSKGYRNITVGIYELYEDVQQFINNYYPGKLVTSVIYADNALTNEYRKLNE